MLNRFKQRLARVPMIGLLRDRYYARFGVRQYFCPAIGCSLQLNRALHGAFLRDQFSEAHVLNATRNLLRPGAVALDIGASIGFHTVFLAKLVGPEGRVLAMEPSPAAMDLLETNLRLHDLHWVEPVKAGAAATSGTAVLNVVCAADGSLTADPRNSMLRQSARSSVGIEISTTSVDDLVSKHKLERLDLVKVDVEGLELAVLSGSTMTLGRFRPSIIVEANDAQTVVACTSWFVERDYRVSVIGTAPHGTHLLASPMRDVTA